MAGTAKDDPVFFRAQLVEQPALENPQKLTKKVLCQNQSTYAKIIFPMDTVLQNGEMWVFRKIAVARHADEQDFPAPSSNPINPRSYSNQTVVPVPRFLFRIHLLLFPGTPIADQTRNDQHNREENKETIRIE